MNVVLPHYIHRLVCFKSFSIHYFPYLIFSSLTYQLFLGLLLIMGCSQ